jgi:hypothetical protein
VYIVRHFRIANTLSLAWTRLTRMFSAVTYESESAKQGHQERLMHCQQSEWAYITPTTMPASQPPHARCRSRPPSRVCGSEP